MGIDLVVYNFMRSIESQNLTVFSKFISILTEPIFLIIVSLFLGIFVYFKKSKKQGILFSLTMISSGILIKVFKEIFQRVRPQNPIVLESGFSFPSGHVTMSIVFFGLAFFLFVRRKNILAKFNVILLIFLISFARIYLRVHWIGDVLGGCILGIIILFLSIFIYKKIEKINF